MEGYTILSKGLPGVTYKITVDDSTDQKIASDILVDATKGPITALLITVQDFDVRIASNVQPTATAGTGLGHLVLATADFGFQGFEDCKAFKFINAVAGQNAVLQITPYYDVEMVDC